MKRMPKIRPKKLYVWLTKPALKKSQNTARYKTIITIKQAVIDTKKFGYISKPKKQTTCKYRPIVLQVHGGGHPTDQW